MRNDFSNFGRGSFKKHFYEIILKSGYCPRRCHLNVGFCLFACLFSFLFVCLFFVVVFVCLFVLFLFVFLFCLFCLFFSPGGHHVQWSGTVLAILIEGHPRNIIVTFFNRVIGLGGVSLFFSAGSHFVQRSETI